MTDSNPDLQPTRTSPSWRLQVLALCAAAVVAACGGGAGGTAAPPTSSATPPQDERLATYAVDAAFGDAGVHLVTPPSTSGPNSQIDVRDLLVTADGGIYAVGTAGPGISSGAIVKLTPSGVPDANCNALGSKIVGSIGGREKPVFNTIRRDGNGALFVGGAAGFRTFAARLDPTTCAPDPSYGTGGAALLVGGQITNSVEALVEVDVAGRAYLATSIGGFVFVGRFTPGGQPDTTYGTNGIARFGPFGGFGAKVLALAHDGSLLVGGQIGQTLSYAPAVARLLPSGELDLAFGDRGYASAAIVSKGTATISSLVALPDGRVLAGGNTSDDIAAPNSVAGYDSFLVRFTSAGQLDSAFGQGGWFRWDWGFSNSNMLSSIIVRRDGRIAGCGHALLPTDGAQRIAIVHFTADGAWAGSGNRAGRALVLKPATAQCSRLIEDSSRRLIVGGVAVSSGFVFRTLE